MSSKVNRKTHHLPKIYRRDFTDLIYQQEPPPQKAFALNVRADFMSILQRTFHPQKKEENDKKRHVRHAAEGELGETPVFIVHTVPFNWAYASETASDLITHH